MASEISNRIARSTSCSTTRSTSRSTTSVAAAKSGDFEIASRRSILSLFSFIIFGLSSECFAYVVSDHQNKSQITILAFGDSGKGNQNQFNVGASMRHTCRIAGCDFALMLGDNIYPFGVWSSNDRKFKTHFEDAYQGFGRFDFWAVLGNHDYLLGQRSVNAEIEYSHKSPRWRLPERNYIIPRLPKWLMIYGMDTVRTSALEIKKMRDYFCSAKGPWKILMGHYPIYSGGNHGSNVVLRQLIDPVLKECGVHFYLSGHDHHLEHTSTPFYQSFVMGSAAEIKPVKILRTEGPVVQKAAFSKLGYGLLKISPTLAEIQFFDDRAEAIYRTGFYLW